MNTYFLRWLTNPVVKLLSHCCLFYLGKKILEKNVVLCTFYCLLLKKIIPWNGPGSECHYIITICSVQIRIWGFFSKVLETLKLKQWNSKNSRTLLTEPQIHICTAYHMTNIIFGPKYPVIIFLGISKCHYMYLQHYIVLNPLFCLFSFSLFGQY